MSSPISSTTPNTLPIEMTSNPVSEDAGTKKVQEIFRIAQVQQTQAPGSSGSDITLNPNVYVHVNPQGGAGEKLSAYMNFPDTTDWGGQLIALDGLARGVVKNEPDTQAFILSQMITDPRFHGAFAEPVEDMAGVTVMREPVLPGYATYIDKTDTMTAQQLLQLLPADDSRYDDLRERLANSNPQERIFVHYELLQQMGQRFNDRLIEEKVYPARMQLHYWDSLLLTMYMLKDAGERGLQDKPVVSVNDWSSGAVKVLSFLGKIEKRVKDGELTSEQAIRQAVNKAITDTLGDKFNNYPRRLLVETVARLRNMNIGGEIKDNPIVDLFIQSSNKGIDGKPQYDILKRAGREIFGTDGSFAPQVSGAEALTGESNEAIKIIPGVNKEVFNTQPTATIARNLPVVKEMLQATMQKHIAPELQNANVIIQAARAVPVKNAPGLAEAYVMGLQDSVLQPEIANGKVVKDPSGNPNMVQGGPVFNNEILLLVIPDQTPSILKAFQSSTSLSPEESAWIQKNAIDGNEDDLNAQWAAMKLELRIMPGSNAESALDTLVSREQDINQRYTAAMTYLDRNVYGNEAGNAITQWGNMLEQMGVTADNENDITLNSLYESHLRAPGRIAAIPANNQHHMATLYHLLGQKTQKILFVAPQLFEDFGFTSQEFNAATSRPSAFTVLPGSKFSGGMALIDGVHPQQFTVSPGAGAVADLNQKSDVQLVTPQKPLSNITSSASGGVGTLTQNAGSTLEVYVPPGQADPDNATLIFDPSKPEEILSALVQTKANYAGIQGHQQKIVGSLSWDTVSQKYSNAAQGVLDASGGQHEPLNIADISHVLNIVESPEAQQQVAQIATNVALETAMDPEGSIMQALREQQQQAQVSTQASQTDRPQQSEQPQQQPVRDVSAERALQDKQQAGQAEAQIKYGGSVSQVGQQPQAGPQQSMAAVRQSSNERVENIIGSWPQSTDPDAGGRTLYQLAHKIYADVVIPAYLELGGNPNSFYSSYMERAVGIVTAAIAESESAANLRVTEPYWESGETLRNSLISELNNINDTIRNQDAYSTEMDSIRQSMLTRIPEWQNIDNATVVFDLDHTLASRQPGELTDMTNLDLNVVNQSGIVAASQQQARNIAENGHAVIKPIWEMLQTANDLMDAGIKVAVITRRLDWQSAETGQQLQNYGLTDNPNFVGFQVTPAESSPEAAEAKVLARENLEQMGFKIVATVGDSPADLTGDVTKDYAVPRAWEPLQVVSNNISHHVANAEDNIVGFSDVLQVSPDITRADGFLQTPWRALLTQKPEGPAYDAAVSWTETDPDFLTERARMLIHSVQDLKSFPATPSPAPSTQQGVIPGSAGEEGASRGVRVDVLAGQPGEVLTLQEAGALSARAISQLEQYGPERLPQVIINMESGGSPYPQISVTLKQVIEGAEQLIGIPNRGGIRSQEALTQYIDNIISKVDTVTYQGKQVDPQTLRDALLDPEGSLSKRVTQYESQAQKAAAGSSGDTQAANSTAESSPQASADQPAANGGTDSDSSGPVTDSMQFGSPFTVTENQGFAKKVADQIMPDGTSFEDTQQHPGYTRIANPDFTKESDGFFPGTIYISPELLQPERLQQQTPVEVAPGEVPSATKPETTQSPLDRLIENTPGVVPATTPQPEGPDATPTITGNPTTTDTPPAPSYPLEITFLDPLTEQQLMDTVKTNAYNRLPPSFQAEITQQEFVALDLHKMDTGMLVADIQAYMNLHPDVKMDGAKRRFSLAVYLTYPPEMKAQLQGWSANAIATDAKVESYNQIAKVNADLAKQIEQNIEQTKADTTAILASTEKTRQQIGTTVATIERTQADRQSLLDQVNSLPKPTIPGIAGDANSQVTAVQNNAVTFSTHAGTRLTTETPPPGFISLDQATGKALNNYPGATSIPPYLFAKDSNGNTALHVVLKEKNAVILHPVPTNLIPVSKDAAVSSFNDGWKNIPALNAHQQHVLFSTYGVKPLNTGTVTGSNGTSEVKSVDIIIPPPPQPVGPGVPSGVGVPGGAPVPVAP